MLSQYARLVANALKRNVVLSLRCLSQNLSKRVLFSTSVENVFPALVVNPDLEQIQKCVDSVVDTVLNAPADVRWSHNGGEVIQCALQNDSSLAQLCESLRTSISSLMPRVAAQIDALRLYNFLWKDDIRKSFVDFAESDPDEKTSLSHISKFQKIENDVRRTFMTRFQHSYVCFPCRCGRYRRKFESTRFAFEPIQ